MPTVPLNGTDIHYELRGDADALFRVSAPFNHSNRFLAAESVLLAQGRDRLAELWIAGGAHAVVIEKAGEVNSAVLGFLEKDR
jgi:hypothetical protein